MRNNYNTEMIVRGWYNKIDNKIHKKIDNKMDRKVFNKLDDKE